MKLTYQLIFESLIASLKKELGYQIGIDKYKTFLSLVNESKIQLNNYENFLSICKILFLQKPGDKDKFITIVNSIIETELNQILGFYALAIQNIPKPANLIEDKDAKLKVPKVIDKNTSKTSGSSSSEQNPLNPKHFKDKKITKYLHFDMLLETGKGGSSAEMQSDNISDDPVQFVHSDEYFPISRRQMVKTWKYLRRKEDLGSSEIIDISATVQKIAEEGLFTKPLFKRRSANRRNTLIMLIDRFGSMEPFHNLSERFLASALGEGGLGGTKTFYFQNLPGKLLFENPDLTGPTSFEEALAFANRNYTVALIISDAGAIRGNYIEGRVNATVSPVNYPVIQRSGFVNRLSQYVAFVAWLNPVPRHRWAGSSAEEIAERIQTMFPVLEEKNFDFQYIIKSLMRRDVS